MSDCKAAPRQRGSVVMGRFVSLFGAALGLALTSAASFA
jgi:hypothetical protein